MAQKSSVLLKLTHEAFSQFLDEAGTPATQNKLKNYVINPFIRVIMNYLWPYILVFFVIISSILLLLLYIILWEKQSPLAPISIAR